MLALLMKHYFGGKRKLKTTEEGGCACFFTLVSAPSSVLEYKSLCFSTKDKGFILRLSSVGDKKRKYESNFHKDESWQTKKLFVLNVGRQKKIHLICFLIRYTVFFFFSQIHVQWLLIFSKFTTLMEYFINSRFTDLRWIFWCLPRLAFQKTETNLGGYMDGTDRWIIWVKFWTNKWIPGMGPFYDIVRTQLYGR